MLSPERVRQLLLPYLSKFPDDLPVRVVTYVELLMRWNTRTNLTAVRDPEQLVQRQVGESLFAAQFLKPHASLLDFGSGAGFPGIPLLLLDPSRSVTLAESQGKKASFLREALRTLGLEAEVFAGRVESMQQDCRFGIVTMRAVDDTKEMLPLAQARVREGGVLLRYLSSAEPATIAGWALISDKRIPLSDGRITVSEAQ